MKRKGFTLVELLAVIAILAILVIIALPNVLKMFNDSKKNSFLTEAKTVYSEISKKYISDSMKDNTNSNHVYCKSNTDTLNPINLSGRDINYYVKTDASGKINSIIVWDNERYIVKKGSINAADLNDALDITDDIKNATCENILEKVGLQEKNNLTEDDLIIDASSTAINIKFKDGTNLSSISSVDYKLYITSSFDSEYKEEKLYETLSGEKGSNFSISVKNPLTTNSANDAIFRVEVYINRSSEYVINKVAKESYCFVAGTKVKTESGFKNIENIKVGERVYSYNLGNNSLELKEVLNTIKSSTIDTYKVTIDNKEVEMSPRHELYIIDKGWVRAYNLKVGDKLLDINGKEVSIVKIEYKKYNKPIDTYNLTVEGNSNYFVTYSTILVHNSPS